MVSICRIPSYRAEPTRLRQDIMHLVREEGLNSSSDYYRTQSRTVSFGDTAFLHRDHHMALISLARVFSSRNTGPMTLLHIDFHSDLGGGFSVIEGRYLLDSAEKTAEEMDIFPDLLPEGGWIIPAIKMGLIGRFVQISPNARVCPGAFRNIIGIPNESFDIHTFFREFNPDDKGPFAVDFCFDVFLNSEFRQQLTLGRDFEDLLARLKSLNPVMAINAFSKMASDLSRMYSNLSNEEASYVVERELEAFGWSGLPVSLYREPRRTFRHSAK